MQFAAVKVSGGLLLAAPRQVSTDFRDGCIAERRRGNDLGWTRNTSKVLVFVVHIKCVVVCVLFTYLIIVCFVSRNTSKVVWLRTNGVNTNWAAAKVMNLTDWGKRYALAFWRR